MNELKYFKKAYAKLLDSYINRANLIKRFFSSSNETAILKVSYPFHGEAIAEYHAKKSEGV